MFSTRTLALVGVIGIAGVLAACGGSSDGPAEIEVTATEFAFDPDALDLSVDQAAEITLINAGTVEHDMTIDEADFTLLAPVGETVTGTLDGLDAGSYEIYCAIPGHREAGMTGTLTVE